VTNYWASIPFVRGSFFRRKKMIKIKWENAERTKEELPSRPNF
jgi:hypothetical protein